MTFSYQFVRRLEEMGETEHDEVFVDGTKVESRANRYTFVWRKSTEKRLAKVWEEVRQEFERCGISGNVTLRKFRELVRSERTLCEKEGIRFVHGTGRRKPPEQRVYEKLESLLEKWEAYEKKLFVMGNGRNSYAKTDPDATFMRMKEDHMRNGQLKPGYNVQIAVNSEYITGVAAFQNRTDSGTLRLFLRRLEQQHGKRYRDVVADAGYESLDNYLYLEGNGQTSFIKPINYEAQKIRKFRQQIGRRENMRYDEQEDCYFYAAGRKLAFRRESTQRSRQGNFLTTTYYRCENCAGCSCRGCAAKQRTALRKNCRSGQTCYGSAVVHSKILRVNNGFYSESIGPFRSKALSAY